MTDSDAATGAYTITTPILTFTKLDPSTIETDKSTYQATLYATGSNFLNVNQVMFSWSGPDSGSMTWKKGNTNWNAAVAVSSDSSMTLRPVVLSKVTGTQRQTWNWTVTLRDNTGKTASRSFTVTYNPKEQPANVTLTLYVHEGSETGPVISGARVQGHDAGGNSFDKTTTSSGYVTITGAPGTWSFTVSKSGYVTNSWSQAITATCTKRAYLQRK